mmetsp:Transcript_12004/g.32938  ORF Transcript_12004/g.32938 Transcript_12004/m.32938 type:complete len:235 (+) Transcript_12004:108-812(+)
MRSWGLQLLRAASCYGPELCCLGEDPAATGAREVADAQDRTVVHARLAVQLHTDPLTSCKLRGPHVPDNAALAVPQDFLVDTQFQRLSRRGRNRSSADQSCCRAALWLCDLRWSRRGGIRRGGGLSGNSRCGGHRHRSCRGGRRAALLFRDLRWRSQRRKDNHGVHHRRRNVSPQVCDAAADGCKLRGDQQQVHTRCSDEPIPKITEGCPTVDSPALCGVLEHVRNHGGEEGPR